MLEESAASIAHFSWLMAYAVTSLLTIAPLFNQAFLGTTLSSTLVYIWSRRNPDVRLSFLGLLTFKAPWLPWVLIAFNVVLHSHWPKDELCGIVVGHGKWTSTHIRHDEAVLIFSQSGTSSTTFTLQRTTGTDRWTRHSGGSACSSETHYPCQKIQNQTCSTPQRSIETSRSPLCRTCGSADDVNETSRSFLFHNMLFCRVLRLFPLITQCRVPTIHSKANRSAYQLCAVSHVAVLAMSMPPDLPDPSCAPFMILFHICLRRWRCGNVIGPPLDDHTSSCASVRESIKQSP